MSTKVIFALYIAVPVLALIWCVYVGCAHR